MSATMHEVLTRFIEECGRVEPHFLTRSDGSLFVNNNRGILYYDRLGKGSWGRGRPARNIPLAQYIGDRFKGGFMLLNGDGMEDNDAMAWQTRIREACQDKFGWIKCAIIPFSALNAAELEYYSIRIIQVTQDRQDTVITPITGVMEIVQMLQNDPNEFVKKYDKVFQPRDSYRPISEVIARGHVDNTTYVEGTVNKRLIRFTVIRDDNNSRESNITVTTASVYGQPENGRFNWHTLSTDIFNEKLEYSWRQQVHRLGAVVFSATDIHGDKARWLSAFDTHEPEPLYFLAQLPSKGKISTYDEAVLALAPPMIHTAIEKGIPVYRQGDVFAIETDWTDEQIYALAKTRVRRDVALQDPVRIYQNRGKLIPPLEGEVTEKIKCPHCEGGKIEVGCGPLAKQALMILHTGHTAAEVVFTEDGRTFIRGSMFHDPYLETPGRERDHQPVELTNKWCICIRNTVPRQKDRKTEVNSHEAEVKVPFPRMHTMPHEFYIDVTLPSRVMPPTGFVFAEHRRPQPGDIWITNVGSIKSYDSNVNKMGGGLRWIIDRVEDAIQDQAAA